MINKKIIILTIFTILIIIATFLIINNNKNRKEIEYVPQEEISTKQERNTIISLYFKNKETNELMPEARIIDAKDLLNNPYITIIELLIKGPQNDKLESLISENTKINSAVLKGNVLYVDFSKEFLNNKSGIEEESKTIYSIVNSLTELNEVSYVRILIDGEENKSFNDNAINFIENFARND